MELRIGSGYDVHRLVEGRALVLCGITVPSAVGEEAHSDGIPMVTWRCMHYVTPCWEHLL